MQTPDYSLQNKPSHVANTVIFTDFMSALQTIEDKSSKSEIIQLLLEKRSYLLTVQLDLFYNGYQDTQIFPVMTKQTGLPSRDQAQYKQREQQHYKQQK